MGKRRDKAGKRSKEPSSQDRAEKVPKEKCAAARPRADRPGRWSTSFRARHPVLRFVVLFGVFMGGLYAVTATSFFEKRGWVPYLDLNAEVSGAILAFLGQDVTVSGRTISSPRASLLIERGCDAIHPSALFVSAVLAAPTSVWSKLWGMVVGTSLLMVTNLVRIITLFYIRKHWPDLFQMMHIEVWQALFIFLAILLWVVWARWAVRRGVEQANASG